MKQRCSASGVCQIDISGHSMKPQSSRQRCFTLIIFVSLKRCMVQAVVARCVLQPHASCCGLMSHWLSLHCRPLKGASTCQVASCAWHSKCKCCQALVVPPVEHLSDGVEVIVHCYCFHRHHRMASNVCCGCRHPQCGHCPGSHAGMQQLPPLGLCCHQSWTHAGLKQHFKCTYESVVGTCPGRRPGRGDF